MNAVSRGCREEKGAFEGCEKGEDMGCWGMEEKHCTCILRRLWPSASCHTPGSSLSRPSAKGFTLSPKRSMIKFISPKICIATPQRSASGVPKLAQPLALAMNVGLTSHHKGAPKSQAQSLTVGDSSRLSNEAVPAGASLRNAGRHENPEDRSAQRHKQGDSLSTSICKTVFKVLLSACISLQSSCRDTSEGALHS